MHKTPEPRARRRSAPLLHLEGIHKWFGGLHALDGVSLKVHAGNRGARRG